MKKIAFLIVSNGVDGRGAETITHAFWHEEARDQIQNLKIGHIPTERIVDDVKALEAVMTKLNPLELLLLQDHFRSMFEDEQ